MEIKEILKKLRNYRYKIIFFTVLGAILGVGVSFLPSKYISSGSFYVNRTINEERNFFTYEGYYGQQTALSYTNSVIALAESIDIKKLVLDKLKIEVNEENIKRLSKMIRVKKTGPQIISVNIKSDSYMLSENIWNSLSEVLLNKTYEVNKNGDSNLMVVKVLDKPVTREGFKSMPLFGLYGSLISFTLYLFFICFKEYLKD